MVCEICRDEAFLAQKAEPAAAEDLGTARDLLDTLIAHKDGCVGMAANMIGVNKRIIAFDNEGEYMVMLNPMIVKRRRAACPSPERGKSGASKASRYSGRTRSFRPGSKPLPAGRQR